MARRQDASKEHVRCDLRLRCNVGAGPFSTQRLASHIGYTTLSVLLLLSAGACERERPKLWQQFSGQRALNHVEALVKFGPRPPGSEALEQSRRYIIDQLQGYGWEVTRQSFSAPTPRGPIRFVNLIARYKGDAAQAHAETQQVIIGSHYETKLFVTIPFVGANDSGSSTGALIELARVAVASPDFAEKLELVFFDGEEAFGEYDQTDGLYGSRYYAKELRDSGRSNQFKGAIIWDMIGDRELTITLPHDSPPELARGILNSAEELGLRHHFSYLTSPIVDDHYPLNHIGIPAIDLIDFDFEAWHTAHDTLDKLSAESLEKIGRITLLFLTQWLEGK
jgi:glutaminyl-peptide cyclotransferase